MGCARAVDHVAVRRSASDPSLTNARQTAPDPAAQSASSTSSSPTGNSSRPPRVPVCGFSSPPRSARGARPEGPTACRSLQTPIRRQTPRPRTARGRCGGWLPAQLARWTAHPSRPRLRVRPACRHERKRLRRPASITHEHQVVCRGGLGSCHLVDRVPLIGERGRRLELTTPSEDCAVPGQRHRELERAPRPPRDLDLPNAQHLVAVDIPHRDRRDLREGAPQLRVVGGVRLGKERVHPVGA